MSAPPRLPSLVLFDPDALAPGGVPADGAREALAALRSAGYTVETTGLEEALGAAGLEPVEVLYVSGSREALEAGRRAGVMLGAALWTAADETSAAALRALHPECQLARPADLTRAIAGWC